MSHSKTTNRRLLTTAACIVLITAPVTAGEDLDRRRSELVQPVMERHVETRMANRADDARLNRFYDALSVDELVSRLDRSVRWNRDLADTLFSGTGDLPRHDRIRWAMAARQASEKAEAIRELVVASRSAFWGDAFNLFADRDIVRKGAGTQTLEDLFRLLRRSNDAVGIGNPLSAESLVDRYLKFGGLPPEQKEIARTELKFVKSVETTAGGRGARLMDLLHTGYGAVQESEPIACEALLTEILAGDGRIDTLDLRMIWDDLYGRVQEDPPPPFRRHTLDG